MRVVASYSEVIGGIRSDVIKAAWVKGTRLRRLHDTLKSFAPQKASCNGDHYLVSKSRVLNHILLVALDAFLALYITICKVRHPSYPNWIALHSIQIPPFLLLNCYYVEFCTQGINPFAVQKSRLCNDFENYGCLLQQLLQYVDELSGQL